MSQIIKSISDSVLPPDVATSYVTDDGTAIPDSHVLNVLGGTGIQTYVDPNLSNNVYIKVTGDGFKWYEKSVNYNIQVEEGVFCDAAITITLPSSSLSLGDSVIIYNHIGASVTIACGVSQFIQFGTDASSIGGTATSSDFGDILELVYKLGDDAWHVIASVGTWALS